MTGKTTHIFVSGAPAWGHIKPFMVFACKLLVEHRRIRPQDSLIVTMAVVGDLKTMLDYEIERCLGPQDEDLKENLHLISLGGKGTNAIQLYQFLLGGFEAFYTSVHNGSPITCQETGRVYTVEQRPNIVIADFFMLNTLAIINKLNEQDRPNEKVPMSTWNSAVLGPVMRIMGPEELGGIGDIGAKAKALAEKTGITFEEAEAELYRPQKGDLVKVPGLPEMFDYEFYTQDNIPEEIVKIQIMLLKQAHQMITDCDGLICTSSAALEPEACKATKAWYEERNKSFYAIGPAHPQDFLADKIDVHGNSKIADLDLSTAKGVEVKAFLDNVYNTSGRHSLLYVSFGTAFWPGEPMWKVVEIVLSLNIPLLLAFDEEKALTCKWTPQQYILAHPTVGWFLTHCGQNSIGEATLRGVPLLAWPMEAEQPGTAAYLTLKSDVAYEILESRAGLGLKPMNRGYQAKGTIEALEEEIRRVLQDAFHGEGGVRKRNNAETLRERIRDGLRSDGESTKDIVRFVEEYL
ncbi:hypothetical protein Clacol_010448 [Clathrus columnatus]|uniref:Uncharacterized protein n=1 Tax=Clathrus columnatus TaxID=1419009 RepID=A0AAV5AU51_9AGAM|nr:hypothetical protein Clacol_010448 [Clathrus columnatus]